MRKLYSLLLWLFMFYESFSQPCSSLTVSCMPTESRCVSTGSILVNASGGSGNYTYKASGPVNPQATSSNNITGLPPGYYSIQVKDLTTGCIKQVDSVHVIGNYEDPRFQLVKTDATCANNDGTISVSSQQFGRGPFTYTIVAPSPSGVGANNTSGHFTGLSWGEYTVQLTDSCGGIQVRKVTIESYFWWFDGINIIRDGCDSANVSINIRDNKNHLNALDSTLFTGFSYGYIMNGDTTWKTTRNFKIFIGHQRQLTIIVKDPCGNIQTYLWDLPEYLKPSLSEVQLTNLTCSNFAGWVWGSNLTNPQFCLYNNSNVQLSCNTTGSFSNLPYGSYCIKAIDVCYDTVITRCFTLTQPQPSIGASINITNQTCSGFTATVTSMQNLTLPGICVYDTNNVQIACNASGVFPNLPYGSYCIKVHDGCMDTTITRCFTVLKPVPVLTTYTISGNSCSGFTVTAGGNNLNNPFYCLYDSLGQAVSCDSTGIFTNINHGTYCIRAISCGDTTNSLCFSSNRPTPSVGSVINSNKLCSFFTATVSGQTNLTTPSYCLYDSNDSLVVCNNTGVFDSIPYGNYCIKVHNTCYDTTIVRCFSATRPVPSLNNTLQKLSSTCDSVTFKATGSNLTEPLYCVYDASNTLLQCDSTGSFTQLYGYYCVKVHDNCFDTTMQVCQTFTPTRGITLTSSKPCVIGKSYVSVLFASGKAPYSIKIYKPDGVKVFDSTVTSNPTQALLPSLSTGLQYKVVGQDSCGNKDSAYVTPAANLVTKSTSVHAKCPSATWLNGSGDILASYTSNHYAVIPQIIKKNGANFIVGYSNVSGNVYTFADLEPAQYIIEYTQQTCDAKLYDTVSIPGYTYPSQGQSTLYQCDNSGFGLTGNVNGGLSPYSYQIFQSVPATPSISTSPQSSPLFYINNGTTYSLVRLRVIDGCGNATLSDISVLPLQNISVHASDSCFFQNILLTVDTVLNATYYWYKKTTPTDSVLLGNGLSYTLPFFQPEEVGQYVCKMVINGNCVTRIARFDLYGCNNGVLSSSVQLHGKKAGRANQLYWNNMKDGTRWIVERRTSADKDFTAIGEVSSKLETTNFFNDEQPQPGLNRYRLRLDLQGRTVYTNIVHLVAGNENITAYPNPVKNEIKIVISSSQSNDYHIELLNAAGTLIYQKQVSKVKEATVLYQRNSDTPPGVYLLRIKNLNNNTTEIRKLLFE